VVLLMNKAKVLESIKKVGVVAVVRAESKEQALKITQAAVLGGIKAIEITFTVPGALEIIKELAKHYEGTDVIIGGGTVLDVETAKKAVDAGAKYIVSPCFVAEIVEFCVKNEIAVMPGAMTVREAFMCMQAKADIIKIFPGELFGPAIIKSIKGPFPNAQMMPTGGVSAQNVAQWIDAGVVAVGAGGSLTAGAKTGDYESITKIAKELVENVALARKEVK